VVPRRAAPRWALGCYWRGDGQPLWKDERWLADETRKSSFGAADAARFGRCWQPPGHRASVLREAYEDWPYYLWREAKTPLDAAVASGAELAGSGDDLALALARGLDTPVGYACRFTGTGPWAAGAPGTGTSRGGRCS
jgi:uncharacterized protein (DUF2126 family)